MKVGVRSRASVEEAPKEPVTSKVEPKVEDAAVIMPTVVEVGVKASAPESWRVSFCLLTPPLKAPVTPERASPMSSVEAKVEEAEAKPKSPEIVEEPSAMKPPLSSTRKIVVEA